MMEGSEAYESYKTCIRRTGNDAQGKALCEQKKAEDAPRQTGGGWWEGLTRVRFGENASVNIQNGTVTAAGTHADGMVTAAGTHGDRMVTAATILSVGTVCAASQPSSGNRVYTAAGIVAAGMVASWLLPQTAASKKK